MWFHRKAFEFFLSLYAAVTSFEGNAVHWPLEFDVLEVVQEREYGKFGEDEKKKRKNSHRVPCSRLKQSALVVVAMEATATRGKCASVRTVFTAFTARKVNHSLRSLV